MGNNIDESPNYKVVVGTSFLTGVILMGAIMYFMTGPHYSYSSGLELLTKHGMVTAIDGTLYYQADAKLSRRELGALSKLSEVYKVELDVVTFQDTAEDGED